MNNAWHRIQDFGRFIYTVGDGTKHETVADLNTLSAANCERAVAIASTDPDAVLFIAGGNGCEFGARRNQIPGALPEARRMQLYIHNRLCSSIPILTDCDSEFRDLTGLPPSSNTPENSRNAAACVSLNEHFRMHTMKIIAEERHLARVVGTFRRKLADSGLFDGTRMATYPVSAPFDPESCQQHLRSESEYLRWERRARLYHMVMGDVIRREFILEWLSGRNYAHLREKTSVRDGA